MNRIGLALLLISLLPCGGCDTGTVQRLNCICLIDYSGSLSQETLNLYVRTISSDVLRRLGEKDRLVVLPIDEAAKTEAVQLVSQDLAERKFLYHSDGYAHAQDSLRARLLRFADLTEPNISTQLLREKELRQNFTYKTDILAAIEQAGALAERNEQETFWDGAKRFVTGRKRIESTNVLLIFSDMIHETGDVSFAGDEGCTPGLADSTLLELQTSGRLPDLQGWTVFVNGRTGKTNAAVDNTRRFWIRYFDLAHARLGAYEYDAGSQIKSFFAKRMAGSG